METNGFLLAANAAVWLGVAGYVFFLARRQQRLDARLRRLEQLDATKDND